MSKIEHKVSKTTEYVYGYLVWSNGQKEIYRKVFPSGEFDLIFDGRLVPRRKVDWNRNRLCIYPVRKYLSKGKTLIISRKGNKVVIRTKK